MSRTAPARSLPVMGFHERTTIALAYFRDANARNFEVMRLRDATQAEYWGKRLEVDLEKGKWSFDKWREIPIGTHREIVFCRYGIIGVYDLSHLHHIEGLATAAARAQSAMDAR